MISREQIVEALSEVEDPELQKSLVELNMIRHVEITGADVKVTVALTTPGCPLKDTIRDSVADRLAQIPGIGNIDVELGSMTQDERDELFGTKMSSSITAPDSKTKVIGVASGKG